MTQAKHPIRLIVGLGNPGNQYNRTRHNVGFWFLDELSSRYRGQFRVEKKFSGEACQVTLVNQSVWLLKPTTFMNRSGLAVRQLSHFYKIEPESILIVHDEIDLPSGTTRLKRGGGHGGHNGLRDIIAHLGKTFLRLRLGVNHPSNRADVINYVLSNPSKHDEQLIHQDIDAAMDVIEWVIKGELEQAMQQLHSR